MRLLLDTHAFLWAINVNHGWARVVAT